MDGDVVAEPLKYFAWEGLVRAFDLLEANDVGLPFGEPRAHVFQALADRIDVPGSDTHGLGRIAVLAGGTRIAQGYAPNAVYMLMRPRGGPKMASFLAIFR